MTMTLTYGVTMAKRRRSNVAVSRLVMLAGVTYFTTRPHRSLSHCRTLVVQVGKEGNKLFANVGGVQAVPLHEARR